MLNVSEIETSQLQCIAISFSSLLRNEAQELLEFMSSAQWIGSIISGSIHSWAWISFLSFPDDSNMQPGLRVIV